MERSEYILAVTQRGSLLRLSRAEAPTHHVYVTGKSGTGKSSLLFAMAEKDLAAGLPPTQVGAMSGFGIATALGFYGTVTPAVVELTGRAPASVRDFVTANRAAFTAAKPKPLRQSTRRGNLARLIYALRSRMYRRGAESLQPLDNPFGPWLSAMS